MKDRSIWTPQVIAISLILTLSGACALSIGQPEKPQPKAEPKPQAPAGCQCDPMLASKLLVLQQQVDKLRAEVDALKEAKSNTTPPPSEKPKASYKAGYRYLWSDGSWRVYNADGTWTSYGSCASCSGGRFRGH